MFSITFNNSLVGIFIALFAVIIAYYKWVFTYWKRKGIQGPQAYIPFGNTGDIFMGRTSFGEFWRKLYFDLKSKGLKHGGIYMFLQKIYIPVDLEIVKNILQNDFQCFTSHGAYSNEELEPLSAHLFSLDGAKWKRIRTLLSPTFTTGKIKLVFPIMVQCAEGLKELLDKLYVSKEAIDARNVIARFTTDMIGTCAFGIECNSMKDPNAEFRKNGVLLTMGRGLKSSLIFIMQLIIPHPVLRFLRFKTINVRAGRFFYKAVESAIEYREKNNILRNDFLNLLIQLKNSDKVEDKETNMKTENTGKRMTLDEIAAQCYIFFLGGYDTSSSAMSFVSYELAINPVIQNKLRNEINVVLEKYNNELTYEAIHEMSYLDKVIFEALRKYPVSPVLFRMCTKDYKIPDSDIVIEKGDRVMIPVFGIHYDPEYYPDPEKFDPERFSEENKASRHNLSWLPFGEGPRICIGMRFGLLQTKIGLITLLKHYNLSLNKKTITPLEFDRQSLVVASKGGIWINIEKI